MANTYIIGKTALITPIEIPFVEQGVSIRGKTLQRSSTITVDTIWGNTNIVPLISQRV